VKYLLKVPNPHTHMAATIDTNFQEAHIDLMFTQMVSRVHQSFLEARAKIVDQ
jgi:hypothetical protein